MSDDTPAYAVREETIDGTTRYYAAFKDGNGTRQEIEIPRAVYLALDDCRKHEQRQIRSGERHVENSRLSEEQLAERASVSSTPLDVAVSLSLDLQAALAALTDTQRRRFLLYHEHGLNYEQIAAVEDCSHPAVLKSIAIAQEKLEKYFSGEGYKKAS